MVRTRAIVRGSGPVRDLPARPAALDALSLDRGDGTRNTLGRYLDQGYVDGLAVLHRGDVIVERYANGMTPGTRHLSQSVAKSVLGLVVGALVSRGVVDPRSPVTELVPEVAGSGYAGATVEHLLDMTAGVDFTEDYAADFWKYDIACGWHPPRPGAPWDSILAYLPTLGPGRFTHGEVFDYLSPNTDLLGIVAERAAGTPLVELIARELWQPLGAAHDAELAVDPAGTAVISGGFCATLLDYARIGQLVLERGGGIVPAGWIDELGAGDPAAFARRAWPEPDSGETGYRHQWWGRAGRTVARGIHGHQVAVDREADVVVAILASWPSATDRVEIAAQHALVGALFGVLAAT